MKINGNLAENLETAKRHVLFQHGDADGWITIARKDPQTNQFRQYHYKPEDLAANLSEWTGENIYLSQNTFYKPKRSIETIRQLRSLYVDLDVYNLGLSPEWVLGKLELEQFGQAIPEPNLVIYSGRGLVLVWTIVPAPTQALPLWKAVEKFFIDTLKEVGADAKASDPARIFRVAGSINSKNGATVRAEYRHDYKYSLREIQHEYLPELTPSDKPKQGGKSKIVRLFSTYSLHYQRAKDIATIVELRNGDVGECREFICFLYRYYTCCFTSDPQEALRETLELNQEFTRPLPESEATRATRSAETAWNAKSNKKADEAAKRLGYPGAGYNIKNSSLIDWLKISEEEQQHLSTIIGRREKLRRRRTTKQQMERAEYLEEQKKKTESKTELLSRTMRENPGISNRAAAKIMGVSESYVRKLKAGLASRS